MANSRGPASLKQLTEDIGCEAATVEEVTKNKKVIIVSIPQKKTYRIFQKICLNIFRRT
jgi:predicted dinucleotide-binding enzyme